ESWIARLTQARHVADHRDRADAVVAAFEPPRRDGRVVDSAVQSEVQLHVPLEPIDDRTLAADPEIWRKSIGDRVRDDVPMPRRSLRVRAVGPELGDRPVKVACTDDQRRVGAAGRRIAGVAVTTVGSKSVRADGAGADVDRRVTRNVEQAAVADDVDSLRLVERIGRRIAEPRRWAGIEG